MKDTSYHYVLLVFIIVGLLWKCVATLSLSLEREREVVGNKTLVGSWVVSWGWKRGQYETSLFLRRSNLTAPPLATARIEALHTLTA
jgi:hypothetical protein